MGKEYLFITTQIKTIVVLKGLELRIEVPCDLVHRDIWGFFSGKTCQGLYRTDLECFIA